MASIEIAKAHLVERLMDDLRYKAQRVQRALDDMQHIIERTRESLERGTIIGTSTVDDNPTKLLSDMEPTVKLLLSLGVPRETVEATRRGQFVSPREWGLTDEEMAQA